MRALSLPCKLQAHTSVMFPPPAEGFAHIVVQDNLNAPRFEIGDVLLANLNVTAWAYDGIYVIQVNDRQVVRYVQDRGAGKLYVYHLSMIDCGYFVDRNCLQILAAVELVSQTRRVA